MALPSKDRTDSLLTAIYREKVTVCLETPACAVSPDKMISAMQDYSNMSRTMLGLGNDLKKLCLGVIAKSTNYRSSLPA